MADRSRDALSYAFALVALLLALGSTTFGVVSTHSATERINQERARNTRAACEDVNSRHDSTIRQLDALIARVPAARQARAKENRASTVLLINALVPKRDCVALVLKSVSQ